MTGLTDAFVTLPSNLLHLTFGDDYNQSLKLKRVSFPKNLQSLTFGSGFNQSLEHVTLPGSLQSRAFGWRFNQSLERVALPSSHVAQQSAELDFRFDVRSGP